MSADPQPRAKKNAPCVDTNSSGDVPSRFGELDAGSTAVVVAATTTAVVARLLADDDDGDAGTLSRLLTSLGAKCLG